jgi:hypothetical protein
LRSCAWLWWYHNRSSVRVSAWRVPLECLSEAYARATSIVYINVSIVYKCRLKLSTVYTACSQETVCNRSCGTERFTHRCRPLPARLGACNPQLLDNFCDIKFLEDSCDVFSVSATTASCSNVSVCDGNGRCMQPGFHPGAHREESNHTGSNVCLP